MVPISLACPLCWLETPIHDVQVFRAANKKTVFAEISGYLAKPSGVLGGGSGSCSRSTSAAIFVLAGGRGGGGDEEEADTQLLVELQRPIHRNHIQVGSLEVGSCHTTPMMAPTRPLHLI